MATENVELVHRWFAEVWTKGRESAIDEMLAPDAVIHGLGEPGVDARGPAAFKPFFAKLQAAFGDMQFTVEQTIADGEWVASRWTARMTHRGDQLGVRATGRRVEVTGMSMGRFREGKMIEGWNNWDQLALMEQIQATPRTVTLLS
jgi:steroid delta-isomerase-like uncharacterized protein